MQDVLSIAPEVADALAARRAVVALESTAIAHGLPHPDNLAVLAAMERAVRDGGAVPAVIAVLDGRIRIGLDGEDIARLADGGDKIEKVSRRDLPLALARGGVGATTVAATMIGARLAGIAVFATGGIGGVHRGAEITMDISADLTELAQTSVMVVCAGAKSILDLGLTLQYLETKGVPVIGYQTEELPAFYTRCSGFKVDIRLDTPDEIAAVFQTKMDCGLAGGMLVTNPIPEEYAMDFETINTAIGNALQEAASLNIKGKEITPFLLDKIQKLTGGESLESNIRLVYNNAALGAKIACALAK